MEKVILHTEEETERFGETLAESLQAGDVLALEGGLGAGKTTLARGIARGLGYKGRVTSPTFAIVGEYLGGRLDMFHFDLYRLDGEDALFDIGWEDYLSRGGVCVVEWAQVAPSAFPSGTIWVRYSNDEDGARVLEIEHR